MVDLKFSKYIALARRNRISFLNLLPLLLQNATEQLRPAFLSKLIGLKEENIRHYD